jgi:ABC-2 type transport system permease protein
LTVGVRNTDPSPPRITNRTSFARQVWVLSRRVLGDVLAAPGTLVFAFIFASGFVILNDGSLGGLPAVARASGGNYLRFIVPSGVIIGTLTGGIAGYLLAQDIEDHYVDRLLTMPLSRAAIVLGPMTLGAGYALAVSATVIGVGAALGAVPTTALPGVIAMLAIAALWGMSVAGYMTATALFSRRLDVTRVVDLCSLPFVYLSPILLPLQHLQGWFRTIAEANPTTYGLEALRALMTTGWQTTVIIRGVAAGVAFASVTLTAATLAARRATARR